MNTKMKTLILSLVILCFTSPAMAWEFNICGINPADFKGRNWKVVATGAIVSVAVHELGHYVAGKAIGSDPSFSWGGAGPKVSNDKDSWRSASRDEQIAFKAAGIFTQSLVSAVLVASNLRHSDFTLGFTGAATVSNTIYAINGGLSEDGSDTDGLDERDFPGREYAAANAALTGWLTLISLDKEK